MFDKIDKHKERDRYDLMSKRILSTDVKDLNKLFDRSRIPLSQQAPYDYYEDAIRCKIDNNQKVLEIGSGIGNYTGIIAETGADLIASDISKKSLEVAARRYKENNNIEFHIADMENLPFQDDTFDAICSAGSLSYGDFLKVRSEIKRVLKKGGLFICVDTLNDNPIYKINRYIDYLRGKRSKSTLNNMMTWRMINSYKQEFDILDIKYFGSLSWLFLFLPDTQYLARISNNFDKSINAKSSCFKFVMITKLK